MKLYFLRHADALPGEDDVARPLSPLGRKQSRKVGRFLKGAGVDFDAAWSSPLDRAVQTAEIVMDLCGSARLSITEALVNEVSPSRFDRWLRGIPPGMNVLLVGHAPSLAERVRAILGAENAAAISLPKAGLACVATENRRTGVLKLLITPKALGIRPTV